MSRWWPSPAAVPNLALCLERRGLRACLAGPASSGSGLLWEENLPLSFDAAALPGEKESAELAEKVRALADKVGREYVSIRVSLPDPALKARILDLEGRFASRGEMERLLAWRLGNEADRGLTLRWLSLGSGNGRSRFLGLGAPAPWVEAMRSALASAGWAASRLDAAFCYRWNACQPFFEASRGGLLLALEQDYWSLVFWDGLGRPEWLRSHWLDASSKPDFISMSREVEQTARVHVYSGAGRNLEGLYLLAPEPWRDEAAACLGDRFQQECRRIVLPAPAGLSDGLRACLLDEA